MIHPKDLDQLCINTIRTLSIDAVQKANSGHPGTPMDAAPTVYCLWQRFLRYDPEDQDWPNRDRFVLSNGHASAMLYSLIYLTGIKVANPTYEQVGCPAVTLDDLKTFRQAGSRCPGHPEYGWTSGVEATTGPLGQGVSTSVGMAIAERWLAETYNRPGFELFDYHVYALCGDGCLMEGVASEAASLAAHLQLSNLCWIYDNNHFTIEGYTRLAFTEDVASRFQGYGWHVTRVSDTNELEMLARAYETFRNTADRPTLIIIESHIGYGAPHKQDTAEADGEPLGPEEVRLAKEFYGWDPDAQFLVPDGVQAHFRAHLGRRGAERHAAWNDRFAAYRRQYPDLADQIDRMQRRELPEVWDHDLPTFPPDPKGLASRDASSQVLNAIAARVPWVLGGAADLAPSTRTRLSFEAAGEFQAPGNGGDGPARGGPGAGRRRARAGGTLRAGTRDVRRARHLLQEEHGLHPDDGHAAADDRLRLDGFAGGAGGLCVRLQQRRARALARQRRGAGRYLAVLADEHRGLGRAAVLGAQGHHLVRGRGEDRRDRAPGGHHSLSGGDLPSPGDMGAARPSQPDLLPRGRQGRPLRGLGRAAALL
jgi:transketolase